MRRYFIALLFCVISAIAPRDVFAAAADVRILDEQGELLTVFVPFSNQTATIQSVASHDLGHDGIAEILVGAGDDADPSVHIFRQDGSFIGSFLAYDVGYRGGVNVAACDVDGDGTTEIVTGAAWGGGPHVRIFSNMGAPKYPGFFAFDASFLGGVNVACGNIDDDGIDDIVVSAGLSGGPHVKVFSAEGTMLAEVFADDRTKNTGAHIALTDRDHDGVDELVTTSMGYDIPTLRTWEFETTTQTLALRETQIFADDASLVVPIQGTYGYTTGGNSQPKVSLLGTTTQSISPFASDARHTIATTTIDHNNHLVLAATSSRMNDDRSAKSIRVSIAQQRLTAYEYGVPVHSFLVSTAKKGYVTPLGKTDVKEKLLYHTYRWSFGVGDPRNYYVPNVKYNLRIEKHIYIHWAYWHNNFGNPMSHGCVNANEENSAWIYSWSDVGTPVNILP